MHCADYSEMLYARQLMGLPTPPPPIDWGAVCHRIVLRSSINQVAHVLGVDRKQVRRIIRTGHVEGNRALLLLFMHFALMGGWDTLSHYAEPPESV